MSVREKVLDKIRALLAKTEDNGCTAEEADAAFAMAQRLMAKHAVDEEALIASGHQTGREPIIKHVVHVRHRDEVRRQRVSIIAAIARANNCRVVDATANRNEVWIVGHESEAFFVEMLSSAVLMQYATERTRGWKAYQRETPAPFRASRFRWLGSFAWGYAERIHERLTEAVEQETAGKALVLRDRNALVQDWMSENLRTRTTKARGATVIGSVHGAGRQAANRADLSGGRNTVRASGGRALG